MSMHTYIGARYVPRFMGTYDNTQQYEALDVVDNGSGTSYIARKIVPANTPLTDTDYWFVYGASTGAIIALQNDMIQAQNDILTLQADVADTPKGEIVVLGDSWADINQHSTYPNRTDWIYTRMAANPKIHNFAATGTGYSDIATQVAAASADTSFDNGNVTNVIIVTGVNDYRTSVTSAAFAAGMKSAGATIKSTFPNAHIVGLADCYSPNSVSGAQTAELCYNWTFAAIDDVGFPYYALALYLPIPKYFEAGSGSSFHLSAAGGAILGKIFDQIVNGEAPNLTLNPAAFAANAGVSKVYGVNAGVATDITSNFRISAPRVNVSGNNSSVYFNLSFTNPVTYDGFIFEFDVNDWTASTPIFANSYDCFFSILTNSATQANNNLCRLRSGLFTGTFAGVSVTDALIVYSDNTKAITTVSGIYTSKYPVLA